MLLSQFTIDELRTQLIDPLQKDLQALKRQPEPEVLLPRIDAAKFLNVTLVTLNDWTKRGFVKSGKIGHRVYYKKSDLINAISK